MKKKSIRVGLENKDKTLSLDVKPCNWFEKFSGLMFTRREKARALLLMDSRRPIVWRIHSFFVFFSFVAVWLDDKNKIIDSGIVNPFTLSIKSKRPFYKLIEVPINKRYKRVLGFLVEDTKDLNT